MKTIREAKAGKATLRLLETPKGYTGVVILDGERRALEEGGNPDDVWMRTQDAAARLNPRFVGFDGARSRFLHFFPQGFAGQDYVSQERAYKLKAKERLDQTAPLTHAATGKGLGEAVLSAYRATNLLSPFEKTRLEPLLRGADADAFIQAAAAFAQGDVAQSLSAMKTILKPYESAKWTVATYLPFLWEPARHFFLKPTMIQDFAERVGHPFAHTYTAELNPDVYASLLDLAETTQREVAALKPRDMIDIQSFMWTSVEYTESDKQALEQTD